RKYAKRGCRVWRTFASARNARSIPDKRSETAARRRHPWPSPQRPPAHRDLMTAARARFIDCLVGGYGPLQELIGRVDCGVGTRAETTPGDRVKPLPHWPKTERTIDTMPVRTASGRRGQASINS